MEEYFILQLPPGFPQVEIQQISNFLLACACLVPGYVPPKVGLLNILAMRYSIEFEKQQTILLPDRNLVSRMARVAREGITQHDEPTKIAVNLMAYCQCLDLQIEPSISYHELASHVGNEGAAEELKWFRIANKSNPTAWVGRAVGKSKGPLDWSETKKEKVNLDRPLHRWRRNYIVALKIAELELSNRSPKERMFDLLDWMRDVFIVAGPAAIFAVFYFSPSASRQGAFKQLRSVHRDRAIDGIKNQTWDITQLSDITRRLKSKSDKRYIFASADKQLIGLARDLLPQD